MSKSLHPAQERALSAMYRVGLDALNKTGTLHRFGGIMAWPMGVGKTPSSLRYVEQVIETVDRYQRPEAKLPSLILCPSQVRSQWAWEAREWVGKVMTVSEENLTSAESMLQGNGPAADILRAIGCVVIVAGYPSVRERLLAIVAKVQPAWVIMNFEIANQHQQWLQDQRWLCLVVDEAHNVKNPDTLRARTVMSIDTQFALMLTGTPVDNRPYDLYNLIKRVDPGAERIVPVGKSVRPSKKKCPFAVSVTKLARAESLPYGYRRDRARQEALEAASALLERRIYSSYYMPEVPETCENCQWYEGPDRYTGYCKKGGNSKGKPPVPIRYRSDSPWWGPRNRFEYRYCEFEQTRFGRRFTGAKNLAELNRRLYDGGWMTRVSRAEVVEFGRPTYQYVALDLEDEQERLYNQVKAGLMKSIESEGELSEVEIRSNLTRMIWLQRIAACTPKDFYESLAESRPEWMDIVVPRNPSPLGTKQEWVMRFMEELEDGDKVVIFTQWRTVSDPLYTRLAEAGYKPLIIRGESNRQERDVAQTRFNHDPSYRVIIVTKAGFEGINLQKGVGENGTLHGVFMDIGWNPKLVTQPMGRIARVGLRGSAWFWFLKGNKTIDEYMIDTLRSKQTYIDRILDGKEVSVDLFNISTKAQLLKIA